MRHEKARSEMVNYGKLLYGKGLFVGTSGNISQRVDDDVMLITPSGSCKGLLEVTEPIEVDISSGKVIGEGRPSIETPFHLAFYQERPNVNAVVHCHPMFCTVLAVAGTKIVTSLTPEALMVLGKDVPMVPYATPGTADLAGSLKDNMGQASAFLMEKHGAIATGSSMKDASHRMETLEFMAQLQYHLMRLGKVEPLPYNEAERILSMMKH
jgi:L-fuculose-phosphate aldolase